VPEVNSSQCASTLAIAKSLANSLQSNFWNGQGYDTGETWTDCNGFEDLNNLMLATGETTWDVVNFNSHLAKLGAANAGNWDDFFRGSYDDA
jgi:hypothetical protein